ncbi:MAG: DUF3097 domain-containing protein [Actinomycetota bacterium]|nr:DUF3097 domain-containing protein [Actinomycetota bacterium]
MEGKPVTRGVKGGHDAEVVQRVWGDDLRVDSVVVERLDGIGSLAMVVAEFAPSRGRRLGVLVDHFVPGTKEARLAAEQINRTCSSPGPPLVDVWEP